MRILVTGAGGLVGSALVPALRRSGWEVLRAVRRPASGADEVSWDVASGHVGSDAPLDAVVHLAGENLFSGRWTRGRKHAIEHSRVGPTERLAEHLARRTPRPRAMIVSSAIGYYGDSGERAVTERDPKGNGFLADVVDRWERACEPARRAGIRVANLRSGMVLARSGGALGTMLLPFRLGLGGPLGGGRQFWSWVSRTDLIQVIRRAIDDPALEGPVNTVAPQPMREREFARVLGAVLGRPAFFPTPAFLVRLVLGGMADALVLCSARVLPERLEGLGHVWRHADLETALRAELGGGEVDGGDGHP